MMEMLDSAHSKRYTESEWERKVRGYMKFRIDFYPKLFIDSKLAVILIRLGYSVNGNGVSGYELDKNSVDLDIYIKDDNYLSQIIDYLRGYIDRGELMLVYAGDKH